MKRINTLLLVFIASLFVTVLYFLYLNLNKTAPISNQPVTPTQTPERTADWITYENQAYGFRLQYPTNYNYVDELPETKTQGGPRSSLTFTDSENNRVISFIIDPAGFGPIFFDKRFDLVYSVENGFMAGNTQIPSNDGRQYLDPNKNTFWYQFNSDTHPNVTIIATSSKNDTKFESEVNQILSTFVFIDQTFGQNEEIRQFANNYARTYINADWDTLRTYLTRPMQQQFDEGRTNPRQDKYLDDQYDIISINKDQNAESYEVTIRFYLDGQPHPNFFGDPKILIVKEDGKWKTLSWYLYQ